MGILESVANEFKSEKIEVNGVACLGLPTGISGKNFSLTKLASARNQPGWIVKGDAITEYKLIGTTKKDELTYLYGPYLEGSPLEDMYTKPVGEKLIRLLELVSALLVLENGKIHLFKMHTRSIIFLNGGGILFIPPASVKELLDIMPEASKLEPYVGINNPDATEEKNDLFSLSAIFYKMVTGRLPFIDRTEEKIKDRIRNAKPVNPALLNPELKPEVSQFIMKGLKKETVVGITLVDWKTKLESWTKDGITAGVTDAVKQSAAVQARNTERRLDSQYRTMRYIEKNWKKYAAIACVVIAVGMVVGVSLKNTIFRERVTKGFTPTQVVNAFYSSINKIDYFTMSDCVLDTGVSNEVDNTMNLYVISKEAMAYTKDSLYLPANEWDKIGRPIPEKAFNKYLYGITNLTIEEKAGEPEPVYVAKFEKWYSETKENLSAENPVQVFYIGNRITEEVYVKKDKEYWLITKIKRLETVPLTDQK